MEPIKISSLVGVLALLVASTLAEPQPQPQQTRPIYGTPASGSPPRPPQQYPAQSFAVGPSPSGPTGNYPRQQGSYATDSGPKPISIHQLPSPNPIQPPVARHQQQQLSSPARQGAPSIIPNNRPSNQILEAQPSFNQPGSLPPRSRFQQTPQSQSKYSSQVKSQGPPAGAQGSKLNQLNSEEVEYEEELEQEPDRLTLLLQESKFSCSGKKDGYYADEGLNCEVFHYCQDGGKHSWMCPNNFAFHQVHLICVPPTSDNICKQSASYHFVNDYLYRPINEKEAQASNASLKYADRYYPDGYTPGTPLDEMLANYDSTQAQYEPRPPPSYKQNSGRPANGGNRNVFYTPESINIPLSQRRPQPAGRAGANNNAAAAKQSSQQQPSYEEYDEEEY